MLEKMIDHTLLKANATREEIEQLCDEAIAYGFISVCVNPLWVKCASNRLAGSSVLVATVIGFPLGSNLSQLKVLETKLALEDGAREFDMVINISALKDQNYSLVKEDIIAVVDAAAGYTVKVILECCYLKDEEKRIACRLAQEAGAQFVKTSTGFGPSGATLQDIALMRDVVGPNFGVKASGGIRDRQTALAMIAQGANRLGTSSGIAIQTI